MAKQLVLLHGWGQDKETWSILESDIGAGVAAWDLPGFGEEKLVDSGWSIPEYAEWVEKKIASKGLRGVVLLGHSFGGRVAAEIASKNPGWLSGLVLYGAPCLYRPSWKIMLVKHLAKKMRWFKLLRRMLISGELGEADRRGLGKIFRRVVAYDQTQQLGRIEVPTLIVWGEKDGAVPLGMAKEMNSLVRGSKLEIIEGGGHNVHLTAPRLFNGIVKRWYESL